MDKSGNGAGAVARCLAEQYRTDLDLFREFQSAAFRWPTLWLMPAMFRDPMEWSLRVLEENAALTRKCVEAMRHNAEAVTECLRQMETSTDDATHTFQEMFKEPMGSERRRAA